MLVVFCLSVFYLTVKWFPSHHGVPEVWSGVEAKPHLVQTLGNAVTLCGPGGRRKGRGGGAGEGS